MKTLIKTDNLLDEVKTTFVVDDTEVGYILSTDNHHIGKIKGEHLERFRDAIIDVVGEGFSIGTDNDYVFFCGIGGK